MVILDGGSDWQPCLEPWYQNHSTHECHEDWGVVDKVHTYVIYHINPGSVYLLAIVISWLAWLGSVGPDECMS
jgi:hypothetical protein